MKKTFIGFSIGVTAACVILIIFLATGLWKNFAQSSEEQPSATRIITPNGGISNSSSGAPEQLTGSDNLRTKIPLEDNELIISVLTYENEEGLAEDQVAAYRYAAEAAGYVYITYLSYDEQTAGYKRRWNAPTAAARPETISLFTQDLVGDRSGCVIVTGMNNRNEHTMTIFRRGQRLPPDRVFNKIAELQINGSIVIQETARSYAYQQGIAAGQSFTIAAYDHDSSSNNILDQIETIYSYNPARDQYEQTNVSKIPGSQIEQRRLRELLSGVPGVFENFINDLWYFVTPQGTIDTKQYLYFSYPGREIIFFGDENQQVFHWQNSTPTRYGLYITSQNFSISTLRRRIDIELESLDSIKLRVSDDVRLKITVNESWDGSYRRAAAANLSETKGITKPTVNASYDSSLGRFQFNVSGEYTLNSGGIVKKGRYVFFKVDEHEILELRPEDGGKGENRTVYRVDSSAGTVLSLHRVSLGTAGIQDMLEPPVTLTRVN